VSSIFLFRYWPHHHQLKYVVFFATHFKKMAKRSKRSKRSKRAKTGKVDGSGVNGVIASASSGSMTVCRDGVCRTQRWGAQPMMVRQSPFEGFRGMHGIPTSFMSELPTLLSRLGPSRGCGCGRPDCGCHMHQMVTQKRSTRRRRSTQGRSTQGRSREATRKKSTQKRSGTRKRSTPKRSGTQKRKKSQRILRKRIRRIRRK